MSPRPRLRHLSFFFFNDTATTEIYTLSLHDALPIYRIQQHLSVATQALGVGSGLELKEFLDVGAGYPHVGLSADQHRPLEDRKSTRLNSSHLVISYAVFCLKKQTGSPAVSIPLSPLA